MKNSKLKIEKIESQKRRLSLKFDSIKDETDLSPEQMQEMSELLDLRAELTKLKLETLLCE